LAIVIEAINLRRHQGTTAREAALLADGERFVRKEQRRRAEVVFVREYVRIAESEGSRRALRWQVERDGVAKFREENPL
jgi:hypothetical protein